MLRVTLKYIQSIIDADRPATVSELKSIWNDLSDIVTKQESTYPLQKDHICFDRGHTMTVVTSKDNGESIFGYCKCGRCGYEEIYQYDYQ